LIHISFVSDQQINLTGMCTVKIAQSV